MTDNLFGSSKPSGPAGTADEIGSKRYYLKRFKRMKELRSPFLRYWIDLSNYVLPRTGRFRNALQDIQTQKRNDFNLLNNTGTIALDRLKAMLMTGITSPARQWIRFKIKDSELAKKKENKVWLEELENRYFEVLQSSNFYAIIPSIYEEVALYGTSAMEVMEHERDVVSFAHMTAGQYVIANNKANEVDTFFYEIPMTVTQIFECYVDSEENPEEARRKLSPDIQRARDRGDMDEVFMIVRGVFPNDNNRMDMEDAQKKGMASGMPWKCVAFEPDARENNNNLLKVEYFKHMPVMVPRWHLLQGDAYGRSPGMTALGDIKMLQDLTRAYLEMIEKAADPPLVARVRANQSKVKRTAGGVTYLPGDGGDSPIEPIYTPHLASTELVSEMQRTEARIDNALHGDLSRKIQNLRPPPGQTGGSRNITATEINALEREAMLQLSPVLERFDHDLLSPMTTKIVQIIIDRGLVSEMPEDLQGTEIKIEFQNIVSVALRDHSNKGIMDYIMFATGGDTQHPIFQDLAKRVHTMLAGMKIAEGMDVPPDTLYSEEELEEVMEQAREEEARQAALMQAQQGADIAESLGKTPGAGGAPMSQQLAEAMEEEE